MEIYKYKIDNDPIDGWLKETTYYKYIRDWKLTVTNYRDTWDWEVERRGRRDYHTESSRTKVDAMIAAIEWVNNHD